MKLKKLGGLLAILLGILVIPLLSVKAEAEKVFELTMRGTIYYNYNNSDGSSGSYKYYNDISEGVTTTFKSEEELLSAVDKARAELTKWAASNNVKEDRFNIIVQDQNRLIKEENGVSVWVDDESDATKIIKEKIINLNGNIDVEKDERITIDKVEISGIKTDYNVGDVPTFGAKTANDGYVIVSEGWCEESQIDDDEEGGMGVMPCHTSNEEENKELKNEKIYFEKFESGKIYTYYIQFKLKDNLKYKFTKDTKAYVNEKKYTYRSQLWVDNYFGRVFVLDFASKTVAEKNEVIIQNRVNEVLDNVYFDEHVGLTDELAEQIKLAKIAGDEVTAKLEIADISDEDKKAIDEKIKDKLTSDMNVVSYMDITIPVMIKGEQKGFITQLSYNAKLTVDSPKDLPAVKEGYERTYAVIRLHDGEIAVLPVTVNEDGTLSFETDRFSDYILTYTDTAVETTTDSTSNPNTGDDVLLWFVISTLSLIGLLSIRKLREN